MIDNLIWLIDKPPYKTSSSDWFRLITECLTELPGVTQVKVSKGIFYYWMKSKYYMKHIGCYPMLWLNTKAVKTQVKVSKGIF